MDAGDEGSGTWNPSAAFRGFERESRIEEGVVPRRKDLWEMFLGATEDNVIDVSKEVGRQVGCGGGREARVLVMHSRIARQNAAVERHSPWKTPSVTGNESQMPWPIWT